MALVDLAVGARIREGLAMDEAMEEGPLPFVVTTEFLRRDIMLVEVAIELGPDDLSVEADDDDDDDVCPAKFKLVEVDPKPFIESVEPPP